MSDGGQTSLVEFPAGTGQDTSGPGGFLRTARPQLVTFSMTEPSCSQPDRNHESNKHGTIKYRYYNS